MATQKNQHFIPQCYLRSFSNLNARAAINLFNIDRRKLFCGAPLKNQCSKNYFYGEDLLIENGLRPFEEAYSEVLRIIQGQSYRFTEEHKSFLKQFWLLQYLRTEAASKRHVEMTEGMTALLGVSGRQYSLEMDEAVKNSINIFINAMDCVDDLKVCLIRNKSKLDFITSDDPAVLTNKWALFRKDLFDWSYGFGSSGVIAVLPLTPRLALIAFDPDTYSIPHKAGWVDIKRKLDIRALNELQFLNCRANIYCGESLVEETLSSLLVGVESNRLQSRHKLNYAVFEQNIEGGKVYKQISIEEAGEHAEAIVHSQNLNPIPLKWPSFINWKRNGSVYTNGSGAGYVRKAQVEKIPATDFVKKPLFYK
jgi:hypothetical protein